MRPPITYWKYLYYLTTCGTTKKFHNYILNRLEKRMRKPVLRSMPVNILIEPCNVCNLKCPGCITGIRHDEAINRQMLDLEHFRRIFGQIKEYVFNISLYNWGEPFLNKNIFSIIESASASGCATTVHSNFNVFDASMAEKAVASRLTHIYLSIDGATQETYEIYRRGGRLSRVIENVRLLVARKQSVKSRFPILTWKYLVFPHNVHEIESARRMAEELKVDAFELIRGNIDNVAVFGREETHDLSTGRTITHQPDFCDSLWDSLIVYPDGSVIPCCQAFRKADVFGNILETSVEEVWNNADFVEMRRMIGSEQVDGIVRHPCRECNIIEKLRRRQADTQRRCA